MSVETLVSQAHQLATRVPFDEAARELQDLLSRRVTAYVAGVNNARTVTRWSQGEVEKPHPDNERQLRAAYEIAKLLLQGDSAQTVRAWFLGMNPQLDGMSPAQALHQGRVREVHSAAQAFVAGG